MKISTAIREAREAHAPRLSQAKLGELVGLSQTTISQIEGGTQTPTLPQIEAINEALGLPKGELLIRGGYVDRPDDHGPITHLHVGESVAMGTSAAINRRLEFLGWDEAAFREACGLRPGLVSSLLDGTWTDLEGDEIRAVSSALGWHSRGVLDVGELVGTPYAHILERFYITVPHPALHTVHPAAAGGTPAALVEQNAAAVAGGRQDELLDHINYMRDDVKKLTAAIERLEERLGGDDADQPVEDPEGEW